VRAWIYDRAIQPLTRGWYREVLMRLAPGSALLDVGIGTAGALVANGDLLRSHRLKVTGIDIDADYVKQATRAVHKGALDHRVHVEICSVYDHQGGPYDAAYFSASFMLMPDPSRALRHVSTLLRPGSPVYFTQTIHHTRNPLVETAKPLLHTVTTIHFGRVTYEDDFRNAVEAGGGSIREWITLHENKQRSFRLAVVDVGHSMGSPASAPSSC
jgi:SAM-dependent methyltransferase